LTERPIIGIGAELRQAREAAGLSTDDVAMQLKYASRQIESLENERFERLPGPTIARGMVRNYARLLKLDPEPLVARMAPGVEKPAEPVERAARLRRPVPFSDGARRSTLVYAVLSLGILVLVGVLAYGWQQERASPRFVTPVAPQIEASAQPVVAEEKEKIDPTPQIAHPKPEPVEKKELKVLAEEKAPMAQAEKPVAPQAEKPVAVQEDKQPLPVETVGYGPHRLVLRTAEDAWMEVRDGAGRQLVYSLAPAGSERVVRGEAPFELVIGNAQHVTLQFDGRPVDLKPHTRRDVARFTLK
jgi:cytoskeleton protein RodZ